MSMFSQVFLDYNLNRMCLVHWMCYVLEYARSSEPSTASVCQYGGVPVQTATTCECSTKCTLCYPSIMECTLLWSLWGIVVVDSCAICIYLYFDFTKYLKRK